MFKIKKYLPILFLAIIVALSSCDGRDKANRNAQNDLLENKVLDSFNDVIKHFPEEYVEVVTDTVLNNGFHIKIKTFTNMEDIILNEFEADSVKYKHFYRNYVGEVTVLLNETLILNKKINKSLFKDLTPDFNWEASIMGPIAINQENSNAKQVQLDVYYCLADSENCKDYKIIIDKSGDLKIQDLNTTQN